MPLRSLDKFLLIGLLILQSNTTYGDNKQNTVPESVANELILISEAASQVILAKQELINSSQRNKQQLFAQAFIDSVKVQYRHSYSKEIDHSQHPYIQALFRSMQSVMEDNRILLLDQNIKDKGLIPATFLVQLSSYFSKRNIPITLKLTGLNQNTINPLNRPNTFEQEAIKQLQHQAKNKITLVQDEQLLFFRPQYFRAQCKSCHQDTSLKNGSFYGGISLTIDLNTPESKASYPTKESQSYSLNKINIAVATHKQHIHQDKNDIKGAWIDYISQLARLIDAKVHFINSPPERLMDMLNKKQVHLAFPVTAHQAQRFNFRVIDGAGLRENPGLCFKQTRFVPFLHSSNLLKRYLILIPNSLKLESFPELKGRQLHTLHGSSYHDRAIQLLSKNRVQAVFVDDSVSMYKESMNKALNLACSSFHGRQSNKHLMAGHALPQKQIDELEMAVRTLGSYNLFFRQQYTNLSNN